MGNLTVLLEAGADTGTEVASGMDAILTGVTTLVSMVGTVFDAMTSNAFLTYCLASAALGIAIGKFKSLRRAA